MEKADITGVILTKNEGKNIRQAIQSLGFCSHILVVDDESTDDTVKIAKKLGARVVIHPLEKNFAAQRNYTLSQVKTSWILFLDADEVVPDELAQEIQKMIANPSGVAGYNIRRQDYFCGRLLRFGETGNISFIRMARKGKGKWEGSVHEEWNIDGEVGYLKNPLHHAPHSSISSFLKKINWYTDILAEEWKDRGKVVHVWEILVNPAAKFISNYILKLGFLDGTSGFIMAMMMSFHSFLVRAKLWLILHPSHHT